MTATFVLGNSALVPTELTDRDPRGLVWIYEPPRPREHYVVGVDPSMGRTGWHRALRTVDDQHTDNAAIEVVRIGKPPEPDVQAAEFAAPIDPYELARYVDFIGRLYAGADEMEQALCIIEIYPGPGFATQRELIEKYGYTNHFVWKYLDQMTPKTTSSLGWTSTPKSVRDLWIKGIRHITNHQIRILSEVTVEELANCQFDQQRMRGAAIGGKHDDRISALLMAVWAAHDWTGQIDFDSEATAEPSRKNWQATDISANEMFDEWEKLWEEWTAE